MNTYDILDDLKLGERDGDFQAIDTGIHQDIARVVVHMDDDEEDYAPGVELARRIVALPKLIEALQCIRDALEDDNDAHYWAADALREAGL
jgi:hypothetical protein